MERFVDQGDSKRLERYLTRFVAEFPIVLKSQGLLLEHAIQLLREEMGFEPCAIALQDEHNVDLLIVRAASARGAGYRGLALPRGMGPQWTVMQLGSPMFFAETGGDPRGCHQEVNGRSGIYAPVIVQKRVIGVLSAHGSESGGFADADLSLLAIVARCLAGAIEVSHLHEQLEEMAMTDSLTGLANRRSFVERLSAEIARSRRTRSVLSIVLMDLDGFKRINDAHGHDVGDRVLIRLAEALVRSSRASDLASRYGGDEFVLMLPDTSNVQARELVSRAGIAKFNVPADKSPLLVLNASWGIATWPLDADDVEGLLRVADRRLYAMKTGSPALEQRHLASLQPIASTLAPILRAHPTKKLHWPASRPASNAFVQFLALMAILSFLSISEDPRLTRHSTIIMATSPALHGPVITRDGAPFTAQTNYMSLAGYHRYLRYHRPARGRTSHRLSDASPTCG
jgi:diguanylate cyclase (GGDEF)-like protein